MKGLRATSECSGVQRSIIARKIGIPYQEAYNSVQSAIRLLKKQGRVKECDHILWIDE